MPPKRKSLAGSSSSTSKRTRPSSTAPDAPSIASRQPGPHFYKPGDLASYIAITVTDDDEDTEYTFVQNTTCQRWGAKLVTQCISCIEKQAFCGSCRFNGLRVFREGVDDNGNKGVDYGDYAFRGNQSQPLETPPAPAKLGKRPVKKASKRNTRSKRAQISLEDQLYSDEEPAAIKKSGKVYLKPVLDALLSPNTKDAAYALPIIAEAFSCHMRREDWHEKTHADATTEARSGLPGGARSMVRIQCTSFSRSTCDICWTSIFMGSYMCGCCGKELCLGCYESWTPSDKITSGKLNRIDQCSRKRRHARDSMLFVTRAEENEVKDTLERVIDYISQNEDTSTRDRQIVAQISTRAAIYPNSPQSKIPKFLPVPYIDHSLLPLEEFQALWRTGGIPLVLTGMLDRFKLPWDPQYFIDMYGEELCLVHDCSDGSVQNATVAGFFSAFLDPDGGGTSSKLKDWPPTADFKDTFPELFADFENALPYPSYTRRSGPLNLASHFPRNWIAPDLGPKMYNASPAPDFVSSDPGQEVIGTTNLHLDLTDAVNIMLYASGGHEDPLLSMDKGIPLCGAVWDIFPPSSANKIRAYLRDCDPLSDVDDPIHRQMYYLSESHLSELASQEVCSYRVFQQPGDAVFIPAGCPHQVRNRQNCVKVAVDFLSAENVSVCKNLVEEARKMAPIVQTAGNKGTQKEDVLQLWSCLGFAWKALEAVQDKIVLPDMVPTSCGGDHTDRASIDRGHTNQTFMGSVLGFVENMERDSKILATGTAYTSAGTTEGNTAPSSNSAVPTSSEVPTKDPAFASTLITPYGDLA